MDINITDSTAFYEWLRNRNESKRDEQRVVIELPNPSFYRKPEPKAEEHSERGVCVIDLG